MTTFVRAPEAARLLGVSTSTLYAYVSRGRITRVTAADGRASLFDTAEVEALAQRSRRQPSGPPPSIDVRISSGVTQLNEDGLSYRGHSVEALVDQPFEKVAELLWGGSLPDATPRWEPAHALAPFGERSSRAESSSAETIRAETSRAESSRAASGGERPGGSGVRDVTVLDLVALATDIAHGCDLPAPDASRMFLASIPAAAGTIGRRGRPYADQIARIWDPRPSPELVSAINTSLVLLADHELATSTLAVRVAASVRSSPLPAIIAGLVTVEGALHGSASLHVHEFLTDAENREPRELLRAYRSERQHVPGFGHKVYRRRDPRFIALLDRVRRLPDPHGRIDVVETVIAEAGMSVPQQPNIDLALGALTYVAGMPAGAPLFAIARVAGWTAHYLEELAERPVRFRGLARTP